MKSSNENGIDVLMLTSHDCANTGWKTFKCLQGLGLKVLFLKGERHPFGYRIQGTIHPLLQGRRYRPIQKCVELEPVAKKARVLHFIASTYIDTGIDPAKKPIVMQHGGTVYRMNSEALNPVYNEFVDASIIQTPDLLELGANNEELICIPVNTDEIQPVYGRGNPKKLIISHYPSCPEVKGTPIVTEVIETLENNPAYRDKFEYVGARAGDNGHGLVPWYENLQRVSHCDIYIEMCNVELGGKRYGAWGNACLEAAALGKIVVTNALLLDTYLKRYGWMAPYVANDRKSLLSTLEHILSFPDNYLAAQKANTRRWAVENHSFEATAKRLWEKVYSQFLRAK